MSGGDRRVSGKGGGFLGRGRVSGRKGRVSAGQGWVSGGRKRESGGPRFGEWKVEQAKATTLFAVSPSPMAGVTESHTATILALLGSAAEAPRLPSYL